MSDREQIFSAIHAALDQLPQRTALPDWPAELTRAQAGRLLDTPAGCRQRLQEEWQAVHGIWLAQLAELTALLAGEGNETAFGYVEPRWAEAVRAACPSLDFATDFDRARVDDYAYAVTSAFGAIAETGTIILTDAVTPARLAALAPWTHIALVPARRVFPTMADALAQIGSDPSVVFVTGPSKTADIEGILIEGVHGPGVQALCLTER